MLKLNLQYSGHLMQIANSLEKTLMLGKIESRNRKGRQRMKWLDGLSRCEFEQTLGDSEEQGSLACCSPWGHRVGHDLLNNMNVRSSALALRWMKEKMYLVCATPLQPSMTLVCKSLISLARKPSAM